MLQVLAKKIEQQTKLQHQHDALIESILMHRLNNIKKRVLPRIYKSDVVPVAERHKNT